VGENINIPENLILQAQMIGMRRKTLMVIGIGESNENG
jgi:hypothetical protein